jgi:hypothetical protein
MAQSPSLSQFSSNPDVRDLFIQQRVEVAGRGFLHDPTDGTTVLSERVQKGKIDRGSFCGWPAWHAQLS